MTPTQSLVCGAPSRSFETREDPGFRITLRDADGGIAGEEKLKTDRHSDLSRNMLKYKYCAMVMSSHDKRHHFFHLSLEFKSNQKYI